METDPHYAQITFNIEIHKINPDGSLTNKISKLELEQLGITNMAAFGVEGFTLQDCVTKLKKVLESLSYE